MQNEFTHILNRLLAQSGKSVSQVANLSGLDRAYVARLLSGEKRNPSLETITRLWLGIAIDPDVVQKHPTFQHGLVYLLHAAAMSTASSRLAEKE